MRYMSITLLTQGIQNGNFNDATDRLRQMKAYEPASEQLRKRKRSESAGGDGGENRGRQPSLMREDDLRTNKRS